MLPKPIDSISIISQHLTHLDVNILEEGDSLLLSQGGENYIIELLSGFAAYCTGDDMKDVVYMNSPYIVGIATIGGYPSGGIRAMTTCVYRIINVKQYISICYENQLWKMNCDVLIFQQSGLTALYLATRHKRNMYTVVALLQVLNLAENSYSRERLHMCDYIVQRSGMSKSSVMQLLSVLIRNKDIEAYRGKLVKMNIRLEDFS